MPETKWTKFRFSPETLRQIDELMPEFGLEDRTNLVRYAISRLYSQVCYDREKKKKKSDKPS
jgi:hypothetical protein